MGLLSLPVLLLHPWVRRDSRTLGSCFPAQPGCSDTDKASGCILGTEYALPSPLAPTFGPFSLGVVTGQDS